MISKVYVVYDSKAQFYQSTFCMRSRGEALRAWAVVAKDVERDIGKFPADYTLFEIADYCDETGSYVMYDSKVSLGTALEYVNA